MSYYAELVRVLSGRTPVVAAHKTQYRGMARRIQLQMSSKTRLPTAPPPFGSSRITPRRTLRTACAYCVRRGYAKEAIADCTEAIRLKPKYVEAYLTRGEAYCDDHDAEKRFADYAEAIRLNPAARRHIKNEHLLTI